MSEINIYATVIQLIESMWYMKQLSINIPSLMIILIVS